MLQAQACSKQPILSIRTFASSAGINKSRSDSSDAWMRRHVSDPYVVRAGKEGYRARSAYKLLEIQKKTRLLRPGMTVVECGAAPGAWTQVATAVVGNSG